MSTLHLPMTPRVGPAYPFGARLAAALFLGVARLFAPLTRPAPPRQRGADEDVRAVRELARQYQSVDPRFAADLYAAADRHERLHGAA
ncbi:MAG TPA: hypothetical protein PKB14_03505 [Rubrivivax sp.]|nr:hypothetical protein [Rubrivivax sp.]